MLFCRCRSHFGWVQGECVYFLCRFRCFLLLNCFLWLFTADGDIELTAKLCAALHDFILIHTHTLCISCKSNETTQFMWGILWFCIVNVKAALFVCMASEIVEVEADTQSALDLWSNFVKSAATADEICLTYRNWQLIRESLRWKTISTSTFRYRGRNYCEIMAAIIFNQNTLSHFQ